jgi:hypothetical protein
MSKVFLNTILEGSFKIAKHYGDLDACKEQGEAASSQSYLRTDNPYAQGSAEREWWDAGFSDAIDEQCGDRL